MQMFRFCATMAIPLAVLPILLIDSANGRTTPPTQGETDAVVTELKSSDSTNIDTAVKQIHDWIVAGTVSQDLWRTWLPQLVKDNRNQDVADLALAGIMGRPGPEAITPLLEFRINAFLA